MFDADDSKDLAEKRPVAASRARDLLPQQFLRRHVPTLPRSGPKASGKRFAGYRRNSIDESTEKSQRRQKSNVAEYAAKAGLVRVRDDYVDEGVTGTSTEERHEFLALIDAVKKGLVEVVVVEDVDRWSRNFADTLHYYQILCDHGVELHDVKHGPLSLAHVTFFGFMAAEGRVRLLEVMGGGKRKAAEAGRHMGPPIYGYRKHPSKRGERVVVPERARVVVWIYEQVRAGVGLSAIARQLSEDKVPSPRQCALEDGLKALPAKSLPWCATEIRHLVTNPLTMGVVIWGRTATTRDPETKRITRHKRAHDDLSVGESSALATVEPELWAAANASLSSRNFGGGSEASRTQVYLMTPITTCERCGSRMHVHDRNGRPAYVCSESVTYGQDRCEANQAVRVDWLELHLLGTLRDLVLGSEEEARFRARYAQTLAAADDVRARRLAVVEKEIGHANGLLEASLTETLTAGVSSERVERWRRAMEAKLADLEETRRGLRTRVDAAEALGRLDTLAKGIGVLMAHAPNRLENPEEVKVACALRRLVKSVVVGPPDERNRRSVTVTVDRMGLVDPDGEAGPVQVLRTTLDVGAEKRREAAEREAAGDRAVEEAARDVRDLDDEAWAILEPLMETVPLVDGRRPRSVIDDMFLLIKTGATLARPPDRCGDPRSFVRAARSTIYAGAWDAVVSALREHRPEHLDGADLRRFASTTWSRKADKVNRGLPARVDDRPSAAKAEELRQLIAASSDERERSRYRVALADVNGCSKGGIADAMGLSQAHVYGVTAAYRRFGARALAAKPRVESLPIARKLSPEQEAEILAVARTGVDPDRRDGNGNPAPVRYEDLIRIAKERFGVAFARMGMLHMLRREGLRLVDVRRPPAPRHADRPGEAA